MSFVKPILIFLLVTQVHWCYPNTALVKSSLFENYTVANGLTDEKIHCVFQDSKGWIWLGTDYGVFRFDGYTFEAFRVHNEASQILAKNLIRVIYEDKAGILWIGTELNGVFRYNREANTLTQLVGEGLSHNSIWDMVEDEEHNLWLGTEGGLCYLNTQTLAITQNFNSSKGHTLPGDWIRKLHIDRHKNLWVGTNKGIVVLNTKLNVTKRILCDGNFEERENEIWEIFEDSYGIIWIGTYLGGLKQYNPSTNQLTDFTLDEENLRAQTVRSILQDFQGDYWFGTRGGLYSYNNYTKTTQFYQNDLNDDYSLIHNSVLDLCIDKKGDLWVGTRNGISFLNFDKQAFGYIAPKPHEAYQLSNSEIYCIWEDAADNLWLGTESGGVNIIDVQANTINHLTVENGLSNNCVKSICPDNLGNILIGTYLGGLNVYNPRTQKIKVYKNDPKDSLSLSDNEVWAILKDSKKRIWVATSGGVDLFNEQNGTFVHYGDIFGVGWVTMIYEDKQRNLWFYQSDIDEMKCVKPDFSATSYKMQSRAMCEDINGNVYLATLGNGLCMIPDGGEPLRYFTVDSGLCSNVLNGIINVNNEYLWMSTNNGISRFDIEKEEFKNYYNTDGLLNTKFNYGAFYKTHNNTLVFGGPKGVDFVYLDKIKKNEYVAPVVLTDFRVFNKPYALRANDSISDCIISELKKVELKHNQNMLSFEFAALNYANSNKNRYKYMLEGFDKEWNHIGTNHTATYTNIDPGEYTLKVIGANNDNVYTQKGLELQITILPPVWKTWWLRSIAILVLFYLFYLIMNMIRNREKLNQELIYERQTARKMQEVDRLKHQLFTNISHEIRTPLTLIAGPVDKLLSYDFKDEVIRKNLDIIKRNSNNLKNLVNQLLDYRRLETGNLQLDLSKGNIRTFLENIVDSFRTVAEEKEIEIDFKTFRDSIFSWFDADKVEKIANNILSNAVKYTRQGGNISVSLSLVFIDDIEERHMLIPPLENEHTPHSKFIKFKVSDSGIGIAQDDISRIFDRFRRLKTDHETLQNGSGIGLALTKELVNLHQGHIRVRSVLKKGSKFTVFLPYFDGENPDNEQINPDAIFAKETDEMHAVSSHQLIAMVVDDNRDLREFIRSHFEPEYKVYECENGKVAWETALEKMPDIIITDVMMPVMNGNDLCKRLKNDERTSHIPLIMLSALSSNESQLEGIDAGADDFLVKPFDMGILKAKANNILSVRKALRERYSKEMVLRPKDIVVASPDEKFLKKLISLIEKNIANEALDVECIAGNLNVSRTQLYRKIGALTDMTPKEFVKDIRLKRAAQLIAQKSNSISDVAYDTGFSDVSYFRKCFKEKFGMSASEYRKKNVVL